jgi:hypothetical protein
LGFARASRLREEVDELRDRVSSLEGHPLRVAGVEEPVAPHGPESRERPAPAAPADSLAPTAALSAALIADVGPPHDPTRPLARHLASAALLVCVAWLGGSVWAYAGRTDRPLALTAALAGLAILAAVVRERARWAGWLGMLFFWLAADAWLDAYLPAGRGAGALLVTLAAGAVALIALLQRDLLRRRGTDLPDVLAAVTLGACLWDGTRRALASQPHLVGTAVAALGLLYFGLGLAASRDAVAAPALRRTQFGIAAGLGVLAAVAWAGPMLGLPLALVLVGAIAVVVARLLRSRSL